MDGAIPTFRSLSDPLIITLISRWGGAGKAIQALLAVKHQQLFEDFLFNILFEKTTKKLSVCKKTIPPCYTKNGVYTSAYWAWESFAYREELETRTT